MMDYLQWRAGLTGLEPDQEITSDFRGKTETFTLLEWTYLLDDAVDLLVTEID